MCEQFLVRKHFLYKILLSTNSLTSNFLTMRNKMTKTTLQRIPAWFLLLLGFVKERRQCLLQPKMRFHLCQTQILGVVQNKTV